MIPRGVQLIGIQFQCNCGYVTDALSEAWEHIRAQIVDGDTRQPRHKRAQQHRMVAVGMGVALPDAATVIGPETSPAGDIHS